MQRANANMAIQHPRFIVLLTPIAKYSSVEPIRSDLVWKNFQFGIPSITHPSGRYSSHRYSHFKSHISTNRHSLPAVIRSDTYNKFRHLLAINIARPYIAEQYRVNPMRRESFSPCRQRRKAWPHRLQTRTGRLCRPSTARLPHLLFSPTQRCRRQHSLIGDSPPEDTEEGAHPSLDRERRPGLNRIGIPRRF